MISTYMIALLLPLAPEPELVDHETVKARIIVDGGEVDSRWATVADAPIEAIAKQLSSWADSKRLTQQTKSVVASEVTDESAILDIELDVPFFMSKMWYQVRATRELLDDGRVRIIWRRRAGSIKRYERSWTLTALEDGRTRIDGAYLLKMPFDPPRFLMGNPGAALVDALVELKEIVGAKSFKAPAKL